MRGNALFLILIAVGLFAALSYAITTSSRGAGGGIKKETGELDRARMVQIGAGMAQAMLRMRINGCLDTEMSVENGVQNPNATTPSDGSCKLFDPAGGGMAQATAAPYIASFEAYPVAGTGDPLKADIIAYFGPLTKEQCIDVNERFGLGDDDPLEYDMFACPTPVDGTFDGSCPTPNFAELPGVTGNLCIDLTPGFGVFYYIHTIMAR